jgi:glycosyltransferase involved in cell wall biosynthesis
MPRRRLLWVTPMLPRRGVTAAQERFWALLARLAPRHDLHLLCFADPDEAAALDALPPGLASVEVVPKAPFRPDDPLALLPQTVAGGHADPSLRAAVAARLAAGRFDLVQYEFVEMANLMPPSPLPTILTVHQLGFAQEGARWRAAGRPLGHGAVLLHRHLRELDYELRAVLRAHRIVTMSPEDAARLRRFHPGLRVTVSPMGVDCVEFRPPAAPVPPATDILFVGHFGHPPNADAVRFLVHEVLPRLGRPARLRVVGRAAPAEIAALARPGAVEVAGAVPDVRPELAAAAVVVAPVRFGTGMRGKVLEALGMGRPVVTTTLGAEGLGATSGRHLLVADDAAAFAAAVRGLLDDPALAARVGASGRALVETRFDWDAIAAGHDVLYEDLLRDPGPLPVPPPDRAGPLRRLAPRLGRWPAIAAGSALLAARAARWHARRLRLEVRRPGVLRQAAGPAV